MKQDPDPLFHETDPRIRIHIKRIRNTAYKYQYTEDDIKLKRSGFSFVHPVMCYYTSVHRKPHFVTQKIRPSEEVPFCIKVLFKPKKNRSSEYYLPAYSINFGNPRAECLNSVTNSYVADTDGMEVIKI